MPADNEDWRRYFCSARRLLPKRAGKQIAPGTAIMRGPERTAGERENSGVVHCVDTVNREVAVFVNGELLAFDVPIGCAVVLHGEPIKLRMVQPQDRVKITYVRRDGFRIALAIEVQPDDIAGHAASVLSGVDQPSRP